MEARSNNIKQKNTWPDISFAEQNCFSFGSDDEPCVVNEVFFILIHKYLC